MIIVFTVLGIALIAGFVFVLLRVKMLTEENNKVKKILATIEAASLSNSKPAEHSKVSKSDEELQIIFLLDVKNVLPVIEYTFKNIDNVTTKDLQLFTVNIHTIKSALANIGETAASKLAFVLEKAGKELDRRFIKTHADVFIDEIQSINARIESKKKTLDSIRDIDEDPIFLQEQLQIIYNACLDYDERPINAAIAALEKLSWRRETQALIDKISEQMLYGDFEEVRKLAYTSEEVMI